MGEKESEYRETGGSTCLERERRVEVIEAVMVNLMTSTRLSSEGIPLGTEDEASDDRTTVGVEFVDVCAVCHERADRVFVAATRGIEKRNFKTTDRAASTAVSRERSGHIASRIRINRER